MNRTIRPIAIITAALAALLASATAGAQDEASWTGVGRIVVFGDIHGDLEKYETMLARAGLVDEDGDWAGGETHLVQIGDIPDRGDDTRAIIDHMRRLERQARRAGGRVHALIGNHEAMNVAGDLRDVTPGEFAAFADRGSRRARERYYRAVVDHLRANPPETGPVDIDDAFRAQWEAEHPLGWVEHRLAWAANGDYGGWVADNDAIIRINDTLFVHAGLGPSFAELSRAEINEAVRTALRAPQADLARADILWSEDSPLWHRGFAHGEEAAETAHLDALLARHGASRLVIGHTAIAPAIAPRFQGRVILTDSAELAGVPDPYPFLVIEGDALTVNHNGRAIPLSVDTADGLAAYYEAAAAADAAPSALRRFIPELLGETATP